MQPDFSVPFLSLSDPGAIAGFVLHHEGMVR
jgi:hypothetical protein